MIIIIIIITIIVIISFNTAANRSVIITLQSRTSNEATGHSPAEKHEHIQEIRAALV